LNCLPEEKNHFLERGSLIGRFKDNSHKKTLMAVSSADDDSPSKDILREQN